MDRWSKWATYAYWGLTLLVLAYGSSRVIQAPVDQVAGPIQKLIYLHLPVAANAFLAALVVCIASVGYIGGRRKVWDDLAHAAATVTTLNGSVLLLTGVFWAKVAWGQWWVWSPRLSFSLILWLLYVVYLAVRLRIHSPQKRAVVGAVYGIVAFLDVPMLYLSMKLLPDVHPTVTGLTREMLPTLWIWFAGVTLLSCGIMGARFALGRAQSGEVKTLPGEPGLGGMAC
ncbi:MAG: cytochrome c biogenesis protein CcsA [Planctomycetota bacterium]